jgi:hypothetical protein
MDQLMPLWSVFLYGVLMLSVVVAAMVVAWREQLDAKAMLRRMKVEDERWAADRQLQERLTEIRDRLYLEGISEERRAQELEVRGRWAARERRAQDFLAQEAAARGDGHRARPYPQGDQDLRLSDLARW